MKLNKRVKIILFLLLISYFAIFFNLEKPKLFDVDEPRYAEAAREMIESGNWVTPYFNYQVRFDKPVFFYWMIAVSYKIFGVNEFAARFPSAFLALILTFLTYLLAFKLKGERFAFYAALIFLTTIELTGLGRFAITDFPLAFFMTTALYSFLLGYLTYEKKIKMRWYLLFFLSMGIAVLTKGPVGIVVPVIIVSVFVIMTGEWPAVLKEMKLSLCILLFSAVALPWYLMVINENGYAFVESFLLKHNVDRFTEVVSGHKGSVFYFIPVLFGGFFPWSYYLPFASFRILRDNIKLKNIHLKPRSEHTQLFFFIWGWFIFLFFSISRSKLPTYIAPAFPAFVFITAYYFDDLISKGGAFFREFKYVSIIGGVSAFLLGLIFVFHKNIAGLFRYTDASFFTSPFELTVLKWGGYLLVSLTLFWVFTAKKYAERGTFYFSASYAFLFIAISTAFILPQVSDIRQKPLFELTEKASGDDSKKLYLFNLGKTSVVFYSRQKVNRINMPEEIEELKKKESDFFLIAKKKDKERVKKIKGVVETDSKGEYILLTVKGK